MIMILPMVYIEIGIAMYNQLSPEPKWYEIGKYISLVSQRASSQTPDGTAFLVGFIVFAMIVATAGCTSMWFDTYRKDRQ